jgi:UDP-N-acetylglucosamine enolpyruvyl transferase
VDASFAEIVVILDAAYEHRLQDAVAMLEAAGVKVHHADDDTSVVGGQVELAHLHAIEKLECVDYVRKVFTYDANFPPGDPRDRDGL